MAIIISHHDAPLPLPNGPTVRPHARTNVERWDLIKNDDIVKGWINAGLLTEEKSEEPVQPSGAKKKAS